MVSEGERIRIQLKYKGEPLKHLTIFQKALFAYNELVPARMTGLQMQTFLMIAVAHARERDLTMTDLREESGELIGMHMNRSYQFFLPPSARNPEGLGWVMTEEDPLDGRRKYLRLTEKGEEIADLFIELIGGKV